MSTGTAPRWRRGTTGWAVLASWVVLYDILLAAENEKMSHSFRRGRHALVWTAWGLVTAHLVLPPFGADPIHVVTERVERMKIKGGRR